MSIPMLLELRDDYWVAAFKNGSQCGVMINGIYDIHVDMDWLAMFPSHDRSRFYDLPKLRQSSKREVRDN
jgi:hypothetical protein